MGLGKRHARARIMLCGFLGIFLGLSGCAKDRDLRPVIANGKRVPKSALSGTFLYLRSLSEVKFTGNDQFYAPGFYLDNDKLVQLVIKETSLDVVALDPLYKDKSAAEKNNILASFPVRHVDILRKQNIDGKDTNEEEETETRRIWNERDYVVVDLSKNALESFKGLKSTNPSDITFEPNQRIAFSIQKQLKDDTLLREQNSFLRFEPSSTYAQRDYPRALQEKFGFFRTTTYRFDPYGRLTDSLKKDFINRWDSSKKVVYYLSKNFPDRLKPMAKTVFQNWNDAFVAAMGKELLVLRENSGQEVGDLRFNLIVYDETQSDHNLIGYGPSVTNPRTGEIIKGDVFIYGNTLRHAIYNERRWGQLIGRGGGLAATRNFPPPVALPERLWTPLDLNQREIQKSVSPINLELIERTRAFLGSDAGMATTARQQNYDDHLHRVTRITEEALGAIADGAKKDLSDDELEIKIFTPLLTHELGHNLGLRHNFMGSADEAHFSQTATSSSVMDYGFFASDEPMTPAPYDIAAIRVAYGNDPTVTKALLAQNFYYCTDEQVMDSRNALCNDFDAGTTLSDVVQNQMKRYAASYFFNNLRLDLVHFGSVDNTYLSRITGYLLPIRLMFDHANAILRYGKTILKTGNQPKDISPADLVKLWTLLKVRIEAGSATSDAATITVPITTTFSVRLDPAKIQAVVSDAQKARRLAFGYLAQIIKDGERPEFDTLDPIYNELQVRGVMPDKLFALRLVFARLSDPIGEAGGTSIFENVHDDAANLYSGVLSNTETIKELGGNIFTNLHLYEPTLREATLNFMVDQIQASTIASGELKELLRFQKISANDPDKIKLDQVIALSTQYRALIVETNSDPTPARKGEIDRKIAINRKALRALNLASLDARDGLSIKAPLTLCDFANLETASGHMLKDNIGVIADQLEVQRVLLERMDPKINTENDLTVKARLQQQKRDLQDAVLLLSRYLETEKSFAEKLYKVYSPN